MAVLVGHLDARSVDLGLRDVASGGPRGESFTNPPLELTEFPSVIRVVQGVHAYGAGDLCEAVPRRRTHALRRRTRRHKLGVLCLDGLQLVEESVVLRVADVGLVQDVVRIVMGRDGLAECGVAFCRVHGAFVSLLVMTTRPGTWPSGRQMITPAPPSTKGGFDQENVRTSSILGLLAVFYLIADAAAAGGGLSSASWLVAAGAIVLPCVPFTIQSLLADEAKGARRVGTLCIALGLLLAGSLGPAAVSITRDIAVAIVWPFAAALVTDLAMFTPDRAPESRLRPLIILLAIAAGACGMAAALPAFELGEMLLIAPPRFAIAPPAFALAAVLIATLIRARRRTWGTPEALASNAWALLGLVPSTILLSAFAYFAFTSGSLLRSDSFRLASAAAAAMIAYAHVALIDPRRRLHAGRAGREAIAFFLPAAACVALIVWLGPRIPRESTVFAAALSILLLAGLWRGLRGQIIRVLSPFGGRLLGAIGEAQRDLSMVADLDELARAALMPLRKAASDVTPTLYTLAPARSVRVDAAGTPRIDSDAVADALEIHLADVPQEIMVTGELKSRVVREASLRPVVEVLEAEDLLCAVPLGVRDEIEGVLFLPRGDRRVPLALEEIEALRVLGRQIGARLSLLGGRDRALSRVSEVVAQADFVEEEKQVLAEDVAQLRGDVEALRTGRSRARVMASPVAYSAAMRRFNEKLQELAPIAGAVTLIAEAGVPIDHVAHTLHNASGRSEGPFLVADASSITDDNTGLLFGDSNQPGHLRLARGGTLLLADLPALPLEVQRQLAECLAVRQARPVGGDGYYPVDVRIIASSRVPLEELGDAIDEELQRWLGSMCVTIPTLRQRREDLPSLVLLALDRACRVLGKQAVGVTQQALDALVGYSWPGNLRELQHVIDRAVARCEGRQVQREDLPELRISLESADPFEGTYSEVEARLLKRAMRVSGGNKSEAARMLGLKRTTFLDKLRRHESD